MWSKVSTTSSRASWPGRRGASGGDEARGATGAGEASTGRGGSGADEASDGPGATGARRRRAAASEASGCAPSRRRPSTIHRSSPKTTTAKRIQPRKARTPCHAEADSPRSAPPESLGAAWPTADPAPASPKSAARVQAITIRRATRLTLRPSVIDAGRRRHRPVRVKRRHCSRGLWQEIGRSRPPGRSNRSAGPFEGRWPGRDQPAAEPAESSASSASLSNSWRGTSPHSASRR